MRLILAAAAALFATGTAHAGPWATMTGEPDAFGSLEAYVWDDEARGVMSLACQHDTVLYTITVSTYRDWDPAVHDGVTVPVDFVFDGAAIDDMPFAWFERDGLALLGFSNTTEVFDPLIDALFSSESRIEVRYGETELSFGTENKEAALAFVEDGCNSLDWPPAE